MATITRLEFLNEYKSEYPAWAQNAPNAHFATPDENRILAGWVIEQPRHTWFNWHMNRTDMRLQQLEARVTWLEKCLSEQITECEQ